MSLTMVLLFFVVAPFAGKSFIEKELSGGVNFLFFSLMQGITFAAGVYVVLAGALVTGAPPMGYILTRWDGVMTPPEAFALSEPEMDEDANDPRIPCL
ncbi:hypothetical protein AP057_09855 [Geobacillus sp. Sah69]|uniref:Uncharacterized protein n=1 Tax=Geobacillus stearothermophilus TaxID=1422 RepID=A0A150N4J2_GEOSE|nr:hypothetical protein AP057_09855 [Geobacillus sp. Sah69]KYD31512.1 hypothetical protein B4114_1679 [Geobacillus stearothermophilus]